MQALSALWGLMVLSAFFALTGFAFGWWFPVAALLAFIVYVMFSGRKTQH